MEKRKALRAILVLALAALSGLSKAGSMEPFPEAELSPEEMGRRQIAARFFEGSSDASILVRSWVAYLGEIIELPGYENSIRMGGFYPNAWCVVIPWNARALGRECFAGRKSLAHVAFEDESELTHVGEYALAGAGLRSLDIPASVRTLGEGCFTGCPLGSITFEPDSHLVTVGEGALSSSNLQCIVLPRSVITLARDCCAWCRSLSLVIFEGNSQLARVGSAAFRRTSLSFIDFPSGEGNLPHGISFGSCIFESSPIMEIFIGGGSSGFLPGSARRNGYSASCRDSPRH
ncbi:MAG: leucine-rich repeat domain-containing protein [Holosporales bacterium]|nr:leucine-rich repeat domain-containing protein [Holosporales bacterium]